MVLDSKPGGQARKAVYRCRGNHYGHTCRALRVRRDLIGPAVLEALSVAFTSPQLVPELRKEIAKEIKRREESSQAAPGALKKRVEAKRREVRRARKRLLEISRDLRPGLEEIVRELEAELKAIESTYAAAQSTKGTLTRAQMEDQQREIVALLATLRDTVPKLSGSAANQMLSQVIDRVEVEMDVQPDRTGLKKDQSRFTLTGGTIHLTRETAGLMTLST